MIRDMSSQRLRERYGAWALVAGATEGVGRAFAATLAKAGVNIILVARTAEKLAEVSQELSQTYGVETATIAVDLASEGASDVLARAVDGRDLGLLVYNAGADTFGSELLGLPLQTWGSLITRNVLTFTKVCYEFAARFVKRGRGALIFVSSDAALGGCGREAIYTGSKAYQLNFSESLWAELQPKGVDVLSVVITVADTPHLRRMVTERGIDPDTLQLAHPDDIAADSIERIANGPTFIFTESRTDPVLANSRRQHTERVTEGLKMFYGA